MPDLHVTNEDALPGNAGGDSPVALADWLAMLWLYNRPKVLWISESHSLLTSMKCLLERCTSVTTARDAVALREQTSCLSSFDAIMLDAALASYPPQVNGSPLLPLLVDVAAAKRPVFILRKQNSPIPLHACTRGGASGFISEGDTDYTSVLLAIRNEIENRRRLRRELIIPVHPELFVGGADDPLAGVMAALAEIAQRGDRGIILLAGEPGCDEETLALELHLRSRRARRSFVPVDCSSISAARFEEAFFGHARGAFGEPEQKGYFEEADGGTLFLDRVDVLSTAQQAHILRPAVTSSLWRVGGRRETLVDVTVIAAARCSTGLSGSEATFILALPSLQERFAIVPRLAQHLCDRICDARRLRRRMLAPGARDRLQARASVGVFSGEGGNLDGLRAEIESAILSHPSERLLEARHFFESVSARETPGDCNRLIIEAGSLVAAYRLITTNESLQDTEHRVRAEMVRALRARLSRAEMRRLFGWSAANMRKHLQILRSKGLLPPNV